MRRTRRIRTIFYGDQALTTGELELLHTPSFQRLYDLHQLGLTDRVFIDASHSRLHHVVGVVEQADKLISAIVRNLRREYGSRSRMAVQVGPPANRRKIGLEQLIRRVEARRGIARLMGMLHDLTHAPYGHTLEDEIQLLDNKHDEPDRQSDAFYRLLCQLLLLIARDNPSSPSMVPNAAKTYLSNPFTLTAPSVEDMIKIAADLLSQPMKAHRMAHDFGPQLLSVLLLDLLVAMQALVRMELFHKDEKSLKPVHIPRSEPYEFERVIRGAFGAAKRNLTDDELFDPHVDSFLIDLIGNTVCADLLDYARRDAHFTNIKTGYDPDRIVESFTLVGYDFKHRTFHQGEKTGARMTEDPFHGYVLRPAISTFAHKLRTDVASGILDLLHARFNLFERALFHSTKCVAGAMLGRALDLLGLRPLPAHMVFFGDQVFLHETAQASRLLHSLLEEIELQKEGTSLDHGLLNTVQDRLSQTRVIGLTDTAIHLLKGQTQRKVGERTPLLREIIPDLEGGIALLDRLMARRFHRTIFRLLPDEGKLGEGAHDAADKDTPQVRLVADFYGNYVNRAKAERSIEHVARLPVGSVVIHCPKYGGHTKLAEVLLVAPTADGSGDGWEKPRALREAQDLQNGIFKEHVNAVSALEKMYWSTWRLTVSVASPYFLEWQSLQGTISQCLVRVMEDAKKLQSGTVTLRNDPNMEVELRLATARAELVEELDSSTEAEPPEPLGITAEEVFGLVEPYGISSQDLMEVRRIVIPEFLAQAEKAIPADRRSELVGKLLARRPKNQLQFNRIEAKDVRAGLEEILKEMAEGNLDETPKY